MSECPLTIDQVTEVKGLPGNSKCCDCGQSFPQWASLSYGTLLCLTCSGIHRGLGVHISFVRSLDLDSWTAKQFNRLLQGGGNNSFNQFLNAQQVTKTNVDRYVTQSAHHFKYILDCKEQGLEVPSTLPAAQVTKFQQTLEAYNGRYQPCDRKPDWFPDNGSSVCTICSRKFTVIFRRHHCRNCGALVCRLCAPRLNTKPIPRLKVKGSVRHCRICYKSPMIKFCSLGNEQ